MQCYETVRDLRWPKGVSCPQCDSKSLVKQGRDKTKPLRQHYQCKDCQVRFDDLSQTIFAGHHQYERVWMLCLYLMELNLSNQQIVAELDLNKDDVQQMTDQLREGIVQSQPWVILEGEVECNEADLKKAAMLEAEGIYVVFRWRFKPHLKTSLDANFSGGLKPLLPIGALREQGIERINAFCPLPFAFLGQKLVIKDNQMPCKKGQPDAVQKRTTRCRAKKGRKGCRRRLKT